MRGPVHAARRLALAGLNRRADRFCLRASGCNGHPRYRDDALDGAAGRRRVALRSWRSLGRRPAPAPRRPRAPPVGNPSIMRRPHAAGSTCRWDPDPQRIHVLQALLQEIRRLGGASGKHVVGHTIPATAHRAQRGPGGGPLGHALDDQIRGSSARTAGAVPTGSPHGNEVEP